MTNKHTFSKGDVYESHGFKVESFPDGYNVLYVDPITCLETILLHGKHEPIGHIKARLIALRDALNSTDLEGLA